MAGFQVDMSPLVNSSMTQARASQGIGQALGGAIGQIGQAVQRNNQQEAQQGLNDLASRAMGGDVEAFQQLMTQSPQSAQQVAQYLQQQQQGNSAIRDEANKDAVRKIHQIQRMPVEDRAKAFAEMVQFEGDDFDQGDIDRLMADPTGAGLRELTVEYLGPDEAKGSYGYGADVKREQGKGAMEGYSFNPSDGTFSIDPMIKGKIEEAKAKGKLELKDKITLNKELTNLVKGTVGVHSAARSLAGLKETSSATDKLAAIFKFMKSLDPTSVVREGEQQMAVATGGAADSMVGYVNSLIGDGKLSSKAFSNMVDTAKNLSNSAVTASGLEVDDYLATFDNDLPEQFKKSLRNRVPSLYEVAKKPAQAAGSAEVTGVTDELSDEELAKMYGG